MNEIKPIIIIGMDRSGTKWLSNILCNHPDICGVQSKRSKGIKESNILKGVMQSKFNLSSFDDYAGFIEVWSNTQFFKLAHADKKKFYRLNPRPDNFYDLFKILMDDYAKRSDKQYWLQKSSPFQAMELLEYFKNGFFILIKRDIVDNLRSSMQLNINRGSRRSIIRAIFSHVLQMKIMYKIRKTKDVPFVKYDKLLENPEEQIKILCDYLKITFNKEMINVPFSRNTSFVKESNKSEVFTGIDELTIKILSRLFSFIPLSVMNGIRKLDIFVTGRQNNFIPSTFSHIKDEYNMHENVSK